MQRQHRRIAVYAALTIALVASVAWLRKRVVLRLEVDDEVLVLMRGSVPFRTDIAQKIDVGINQQVETRVKLGDFAIHLNEFVDVPLKMNVSVPVDADVLIDQPLDLAIDVPIDTVLSERELDLNQLTIPIDQDVFINDSVKIDTFVPINTTVKTALGVTVPVSANIPVKMDVPIRQKLHVKDQLKLALKDVRVPLKMVVPVRLQVPVHQTFRVRGTISAPIEHVLRVPIRKDIHPAMISDVPASVTIAGKFPAEVRGKLDAVVALDKGFMTRLGPMKLSAKNLTAHLRD